MSSEESTQPPNGTTIGRCITGSRNRHRPGAITPGTAEGLRRSRICPFGLGLKLETLHPFQGQYRPFVGRPCQSCNSKSMEAFFYKRHTKMGFCNAIRITEENTRYRGWLVRRLCHLLFIWGKPVDQDLSIEWSEKICKFPRIQSAIEIEKEKNDRPPVSASAPSNEAHKEVLSIFGHIQKSLSPRLIRITSWILVKLLNRLYLNLQLHCGQVATLKEASAACPKTPLVFLCTHPSWLDFFLVPFILFSQNLRVPQVAWDGTDCSPLIRNSMFDEPALDKDRATAQEPEQALVNGFLLHSLRAAVSCTAIMPSHIIAALLLHKYRVGVSLSRLLSDLPEITEDILLHGFDVAFSGQRWDILRHSLYILRHCTGLYVAPSNDVYVLCRESPNSIRELAQKSSSLLPVFLYEAIGACAIHALLAQLPSLCLVEILFTQDEMIEMMMCLGSLLHRNILIMPPCQNAYLVCQDILDKLVHCGLLSMYEDPSAPAACDTGRRRFVDKLMWRDFNDMSDSDSDIGENLKRHYKLGRSSRNADFFVFLCHLLNPVLKTYERAALFLQERGMAGPEPETDYITRLHQYLLEKAKEDCSYECAERSLAACAVRTFIDLGVFECSQSCHGSILHLSETFLLEDNCKNLTTFIQQFIYRR
ncbi:glycerol-3-phosphate acyltransferase 2, mitochondrial isoform X5 [Dendropsophus ebraccatus]|uniref:glycerol-3-phosphate acyltransferase 2, mitochondrial isoform X5 n=1 Tax=Dendropsophus ebraccatus TaxID=150705 RepID=UPI003831050F